MQGREAANAGDVVTAKKKINRSLYCNIASIVGAVFGLIGAVVLFLFIFVMIGLLSTQWQLQHSCNHVLCVKLQLHCVSQPL